MKGIRRVATGYETVISYRGKYYRKWFSDRAHGGEIEAKKAAIAWKRKRQAEFGLPDTEHRILTVTRSGKQDDLPNGIILIRREEGRSPCYRAHIRVNGKLKTFSRSVAEHKDALAQVLKQREQWEREVYGGVVPK